MQAVPDSIAAALQQRAWYFVPLAIGENDETVVAPDYTVDFSDRAICHRNVRFGGSECIFISTRLMQDRFALAFEFFINVGHHFVEWSECRRASAIWRGRRRRRMCAARPARMRGRTGRRALTGAAATNRMRRRRPVTSTSTFSDAIAIYLLSLSIDFDYADLREREYPLLAAPALAERLRHMAEMFLRMPGTSLRSSTVGGARNTSSLCREIVYFKQFSWDWSNLLKLRLCVFAEQVFHPTLCFAKDGAQAKLLKISILRSSLSAPRVLL